MVLRCNRDRFADRLYNDGMLTVADCVHLACVLEATARKPGNVHRFHDFDDLTYLDFILSAAAVAPILETTAERGVGVTVLDAIRATQRFVNTNTNLGIVLLLAPLAAVPRAYELRSGAADVLNRLNVDDSRAVFEAIRTVNPGGLGEAPEQDVRSEPTLPLREVMALAANRDLIARQYANGFRDVFEIGVPALLSPSLPASGGEGWGEGGNASLESAIIHCHLRLLAANPDSHIARRCGTETAIEASRRAALVLDGAVALAKFDAWLRGDGHRCNPGSTADLVTACLFAALRDGKIPVPFRFH
jgi:triphosphoribosyl-dephospho-CoA synthase